MFWRSPAASKSQSPSHPQDLGFVEHLYANSWLTLTQKQRVEAVAKSTAQDVEAVLLELGLLRDDALADALSSYTGYARLADAGLQVPLQDASLPADFMHETAMVAISRFDNTLLVASAKVLRADAFESLAYYTSCDIEVRVATESEIKRLQAIASPIEHSASDNDVADADAEDIERIRDAARDAPTIKLVSRLISDAVQLGASDIHIEPQNEQVLVRFRIDGVLRVVENLPKHLQPGIVSRIKILSRLNIAEQRLPQDGRMRAAVRGKDIDFRVSTTPVLNGESIALRILDRHEVMLDFAAIGFSETEIAQLKSLCSETKWYCSGYWANW